MVSYWAFLISLYASVPATAAGILSPSLTVPISDVSNFQTALITPLPGFGPGSELRKRQTSASWDGRYFCGYGGGRFSYYTCNNHAAYCAGTILPNSQAYVYCSTSQAVIQPVITTGLSSWADGKACPSSATCCSAASPNVMTNLFIASGYTATGFNCWSNERTITWDPDINVLNPASFSASLIQLTQQTSSSTTPSSNNSPTTSTPGGESGSEPLGPSRSSSAAASSSSGLSSGTKIGIGAGVGIGVGIILISGALFILWRRHQKKKDRIAEPSHTQAVYSPQAPYSQPLSQSEVDYQYKYAQGGGGQMVQGPYPYGQSPYFGSDPRYPGQVPSPPQELSGQSVAHELQ